MTVTDELILVDHQSVDADRSARMRSIRADSHLRAEAVSESVGEMRRRIPVDAGRVDLVEEALRARRIFGHDGIRVRRTVASDVFDGVVEVFNRAYRKNQVEELVAK